MDDPRWMRRALALAARGTGNTSPNPMVGAVVVAPDGTLVGSGFHSRAGAQHAETEALAQAGDRARGATLYVTLEPCAHHGRTPPCADAIAAAGIRRVVAAMQDPDSHVNGRGLDRLRATGIDVTAGVLENEACELNAAYVHHRTTGMPLLALKMAQTKDGAVGASRTERRRLTGPLADAFVRELRMEYDAVMVGVDTVIVDDPQLTVRPPVQRAVEYLRVVVDSRGRIPLGSRLVQDRSQARTLVATTGEMPSNVRDRLTQAGVEILECARDERGRVDVRDLMRRLGERDVLSVLCEGGPTLAGSLVSAGLVDRFFWLIAPFTIGAGKKIPVLALESKLALELDVDAVTQLGDDVLVSARPRRTAASSPV